MLSFVSDGRVGQVLVKQGQTVRAGQVLAKLDDAAERIQVEQLKAQADSQTLIEVRRAQLEQKTSYLEELKDPRRSGAVTKWEIRNAELDVRIAKAQLDLAKLEHEQDMRKYEQAKIQLQRMQLISPIDGRVEEIHIKPGESARQLADAIRVVQLEPLRIELPVPVDQAIALHPGQTAQVRFVDDPSVLVEGRIVYVGSVADYGSYTLMVHVELPEGLNRPAGEEVIVSFPHKTRAEKGDTRDTSHTN